MKKLLLSVLAGVVVASFASSAFATHNTTANIAVDLRAKIMGVNPGSCAGLPTYTACSQITQAKTPWALGDLAIVTVYSYTEMQGVEFGLTWTTNCDFNTDPGYYLYPTWTRCGTAPDIWNQQSCALNGVGRISEAGAWTGCNTTFATVVCWAAMAAPAGAPGTIRLGFGPSDTHVEYIASCHQELDNLHTLHDGFLNGQPPVPSDPLSLPPCQNGPTSTANATWSSVKALYH